ncbi:ABC transporter permease [Natronospora cellulosivora (SeqCode)]
MYKTFLISELKKWAREPLTRLLVFYPLIFGLIGRYLLPYLAETTDFVLEQYADIILVALTLMMPLVFGALIGFSMLDDRDDNILSAVKVTPLGLGKFFLFRLIMIFFFATLACIFVILFSDILSLDLSRVIAISILAGLSAPATGMFINSFAKNKIEGFAVMKGFGTLIVFPIVAMFFLDFKELFFSFAPGFFPAKALSALIRGEEALFLTYNQYYIIGWIYGIVLNLLVYKLFVNKVKEF